MEDLVVLYNGEIVYLSSISEDTIFNPLNPDLLFFNNGRIRRFKKNGIAYMAIFDSDTNTFDSYRSEINFWNYNIRSASTNDSSTEYEKLGPRFNVLDVIPINVNQNSNVILAHEMIYPDSLDSAGTTGIQIETIYRRIPYSVAKPLAKTINLQSTPSFNTYPILSAGTQNVSSTLTNYYNFIINKKYLGSNGLLRDINDNEISVLGDVIQVFDFIFKQTVFINLLETLGLKEPFVKSVDLVNRFNNQYGEIEDKYHILYTDEYFARIRLGLIEFKYWLIQYSDDYSKVDENELIFEILNIFDSTELSYLSYDIKINILNRILLNNPRVINETVELGILKIIQSIADEDLNVEANQNDCNNFLDYLTTIYDVKNNLTLFEVLYSNIDDNRSSRYTFGIFDTQNNRLKLIVILYQVWKKSRYNPHYEDSSYTLPRNQFGVFPESYFMALENDTNGIQKTKYFNALSSPPVFVFNTSSDSFHFHSETTFKIEKWKGEYIEINEIRESSVFDGHFTSHDSVSKLYGIYHLYQPITIIGFKPDLDLVESFKDPETELNLFGETPVIPAFIFEYLENYSSLKKIDFGIMLGVEIALNLTGVGALSKLRYINYLSKARGAILGTETATNTLLFYEAASGANAAVQFTAGNFMAISNYVSNTTTDPDEQRFMNKVCAFCGIVTIFSVCAHPSVKRRLLDSAADVLAEEQKLILAGKTHGLSVNVMDSIRGLYGIDGLIDLMQLKLNNLPSIANQTVIGKFAAFTNDEKYQFFTYFYNIQEESKWIRMDFQYSRVVSGNVQQYTLVDIWKDEIQFLKKYRTFEFINAYNFIKYDVINIKFRSHFFEGDIKMMGSLKNSSGFHHIEGNLNINNYGRVDVIVRNPDYLGYYVAQVSVKEPTTGLFISKGYIKKINGVPTKFPIDNDMFPRSWNQDKILENIALAHTNKFYTGISNQYMGRMSDGKYLIMCIDDVNLSTEKFRTAWPKR